MMNYYNFTSLYQLAVSFVLILLSGLFHIGANAHADESELVRVPKELEPWVSWVEDRHPEWKCAWHEKSYNCLWPGIIRYELSPKGAKFALSVELQKKDAVLIPSSLGLYPRNIEVKDHLERPVIASFELRNNLIFVVLPPGLFTVEGELNWGELPPEIPLPHNYGIVEIAKDKLPNNISIKRRQNSLWVEEKEQDNFQGKQSAKLTVMRQVRDGSPVQIDTLLRLKVSGRARPVDLGQVIPINSLPVAISSKLPHYLSADGKLALQLTPGEFEISILSIIAQPALEISLPVPTSELWPSEEILSFKSNTLLRTVEVSGAKAIHTDATELPKEWLGGSTYAIASGNRLSLKELRRGMQKPAPNELNLNREIWVDLDNTNFTVRDTFTGTMHKGFRLNALPETQLGRASINQVPVLISKEPSTELWGVELRDSNVQVQAVSRYEGSSLIPAVGWNATVSTFSGLLHLPPSWKLFAILGADTKGTAWIDSWSLLEFFLCFLVVLASYKLFNLPIAILVAVCTIINHGEFLAPRMLFVHLLFLVLWRSVISDEKSTWHYACRILLSLTFCALIIESLAFSKLQFTQFLFPQLHAGTRYRSFIQQLYVGIELTPLVWPAILFCAGLFIAWLLSVIKGKGIKTRVLKTLLYGFILLVTLPIISLLVSFELHSSVYDSSESFRSLPVSKSAMTASPSRAYQQVHVLESDKEKTNQTKVEKKVTLTSGPAIPGWRWRAHRFYLAGPLGPDYQLRVLSIPAKVIRFICAFRVILIITLMLLLLRRIWTKPIELLTSFGKVNSALTIAFLLLLGNIDYANAEIPSDSILDELEQRLVEKHCKRDVCTVIESANVQISQENFRISMKVSSDGMGVVSVPGPLDVLDPKNVVLNGNQHIGLRRNKRGFLEIRTNPGMNVIEMSGQAPSLNAFSLEFLQRPLVVNVISPKWFVEGLLPSGFVPKTLRFTAKDGDFQQKDRRSLVSSKAKLVSWAIVSRLIHISEGVRVETTVKRLGGLSADEHIKVPLLASEQVTSGNVKVERGFAYLAFSPKVETLQYTSTLSKETMRWELQGAMSKRMSEEWIVSCDSNIHCSISGINPTKTVVDGRAKWLWLPFPGEKVLVKAWSLETVAGEFLTVDELKHSVTWGTRLLEGHLKLRTRVTQATSFNVRLPSQSELQDITIDNVAGGNIQSGLNNQVLLNPGAHVIDVSYQKPFSPKYFEKVPDVAINTPAHNVSVSVFPREDRWVLWAGGASWGPCVVYWAKLIVVVLLCVALVYMKAISITRFDAVFLGVGLTTLPVIFLWIPLFWLGSLVVIPKYETMFRHLHRGFRITCFVVLTFISLLMLYAVVKTGLVLEPPMLIVGNNSTYSELKWYTDHTSNELLRPWVLSLPMFYWRVFSLVWSMWLVVRLFAWLKISLNTLIEKLYPA